MSVIAWSDVCVLIDHNQYLKDNYNTCCDFRACANNDLPHQHVKLTGRDLLFDVRTQYKMDSEAVAASTKDADKHRNKRKIEPVLLVALTRLRELARETNYFIAPPTVGDVLFNNASCRAAARFIENGDCCVNFHSVLKDGDVMAPGCNHHRLSLNNDVAEYGGDQPGLFDCGTKTLVLPPSSSFLCSDIEEITQLLNLGRTYDVIVIDPPWTNKSVKRKKTYYELNDDDLKMLPIPALTNPGSFLFVWVTNRKAHMELLRDTLFPMWNADLVAEWHWLKVTTSGEPILHLDSQQKKPYENILIGRIKGAESILNLKNHFVIGSVPSSIHSQKPPLAEILKKLLPDSSTCLELFARNLTPNWTSWGNEVLKFQEAGKQLLQC